MSTRLMAIAWPMRMPPTRKAVLISLADQANDDGFCWPSITTMCERTCLGRTAVIEAIKGLEDAGLVVADRSNGRHTTYRLTLANPSASRTGGAVANQSASRTSPSAEPVRQPDGTSPLAGRDQSASRTLTVKEPLRNRKKEDAPECPPGVDPKHWRDWLAARKARRAVAVTESVMDGIRREAAKAGISLGDAVRISAERSWVGFCAAWDWQQTARSTGAIGPRTAADDRRAFVASITGHHNARPTTDPRTIDVDQPEPAAPRLAIGGR